MPLVGEDEYKELAGKFEAEMRRRLVLVPGRSGR